MVNRVGIRLNFENNVYRGRGVMFEKMRKKLFSENWYELLSMNVYNSSSILYSTRNASSVNK